MGKKLSPEDRKLYERCDEVLHYIWDPIGVAGASAARDEYQSYLPQVFKLVRGGADKNQLVDYLVSIETERMGLTTNRAGATRAAGVLLNWCDWSAKEAL